MPPASGPQPFIHRSAVSECEFQDQIPQGSAAGNQFRTAPLWGLGQRVFFLHDGRSSTDLLDTIMQHASDGSEANGSVQKFLGLTKDQQQAILNFLRSL
jgi:CxxC motif-containing protein (DUF1111 family)